MYARLSNDRERENRPRKDRGPRQQQQKDGARPFVGSIYSDGMRMALSPNPTTSTSPSTVATLQVDGQNHHHGGVGFGRSDHFQPQFDRSENSSGEEIWSDEAAKAGRFYGEEGSGLLGPSGASRVKGDGYVRTQLRDDDVEDGDEDDDFDEMDRRDRQETGLKRQRRQIIILTAFFVVLLLGAVTAVVVMMVVAPAPAPASPSTGLAEADLVAFGPTVVLVSLDGFRAEYLTRGLTPQLAKMAYSGAIAEWMTPAFPSITFPNHYTLVTGLYPESHGIVGNVFYDPDMNDTFVYVDSSKNSQSKWWGGEPLWVTSIKQGKRSATCMWPGSEAPIQNIRPNYWLKYDGKMSLSNRADQILAWLDLPLGERPSFLTLYASDVDSAGHSYGPNSKAVNDSLIAVDHMIGRLLDGVAARNLTDHVNLVVVSDHGMTETADNWIYLDDYVDYDKFDVVNNLVAFLYPKKPSETQTVFEAWKAASQESGKWNVWMKEDVPAEYHFRHNIRIGPIVAVPEKGWSFSLRKTHTAKERRGGMHGYNNTLEDMRAIFVASGPAFRQTEVSLGELSADWVVPDGNHLVNHNITEAPIGSGEALGGSLGHPGHQNISWTPTKNESVLAGSTSEKASGGTAAGGASEVRRSVLLEDVKGEFIPHFNNVELYGLLCHVLGLTPAANNGTNLDIFKPFLV
ncbi:hypothetical protein HK101_010963 [Irineochytrium annulatum]|nr:hypothetical protein HK101_010963 [Irineochytrium annulatum]